MNIFLEYALAYLAMGFAVYPAHSISKAGLCSCGDSSCKCPGKHPIGHWLEYQQRKPTKQEVKLWFSSLDCNIGTLTGAVSGIAVVDVDGPAGLQSLATLNLAKTMYARTGGGGYHYFYRSNRPTPSKVGILKGIDIRADGGFVVLPPSLHKSTRRYEWPKRPPPMAPFDNELFDRYSSTTQSSSMLWVGELFEGVTEGNRSISAARLAGRYFNLGLSFQETFILMSVWNNNNRPPLLEHELKRTVLGVERKHLSNSGNVTTASDIMYMLKGANKNLLV